MYLDCLRCPKLGESCDGPNFLALSSAQLLDWCKQRKSLLGWTNQKVADMSNTPKGTIDRLFSGSYMDYRYETIRPVLKALVGCTEWGGNPCDLPTDTGTAPDPEMVARLESQAARIREMEAENHSLSHALELERQHRQDVDEAKQQTAELLQFVKRQIKARGTAIVVLAIAFGLCFLLIIIALIIDRLNGNIGFFWLD